MVERGHPLIVTENPKPCRFPAAPRWSAVTAVTAGERRSMLIGPRSIVGRESRLAFGQSYRPGHTVIAATVQPQAKAMKAS